MDTSTDINVSSGILVINDTARDVVVTDLYSVQEREDFYFLPQGSVLSMANLHDQYMEEKTYKLVIKGLPLSMQSKDIELFV